MEFCPENQILDHLVSHPHKRLEVGESHQLSSFPKFVLENLAALLLGGVHFSKDRE